MGVGGWRGVVIEVTRPSSPGSPGRDYGQWTAVWDERDASRRRKEERVDIDTRYVNFRLV